MLRLVQHSLFELMYL